MKDYKKPLINLSKWDYRQKRKTGREKMTKTKHIIEIPDMYSDNFAVFWNNEYIGEAKEILIKKGDCKKGYMPLIKIKGELQIARK